jgi:hypothetical protein
VITELAKNRRGVAAAKMVLRSVGVSPSRNCDLVPRDTAAIRDASIGRPPSVEMGESFLRGRLGKRIPSTVVKELRLERHSSGVVG